MQLADDVSFEIYFGKIGEIKFPKKNIPEFFDRICHDFLGKFQESD